MDVLVFLGSPRKKGNTSLLIQQVFNELEQEGIETELDGLMANHSSADAYEGLSTSGVRRPVFKGE